MKDQRSKIQPEALVELAPLTELLGVEETEAAAVNSDNLTDYSRKKYLF